MNTYINFIGRYYKQVLIAILLLTLLAGWQAAGLQTNATPYFLDKDHPSRVADRELKKIFKGSGEVLIVATETKSETIFNPRSLDELYRFTLAAEALTLTNEEDVTRLKNIIATAGLDRSLRDAFERVNQFVPADYTRIKAVARAVKGSDKVSAGQKAFLRRLLFRVWPVKKVRGIVRIESITADGADDFDIHALMPKPPRSEAGIKALESEALGNEQLKDILFNPRDKRVVNTLIELRIPQDDAPDMKRLYDRVSKIPRAISAKDSYHISGPPAIFAQTAAVVKSNSDRMFPFVILVIGTVLYLLFRDKRTMLFPILVAVVSIVWTLGSMAFLGYEQNIVSTLIPVFLISIGVSDSIHFYSEYNRLADGDRLDKVQRVLGKMLKPMLFTSLTTMTGFLALSYTPIGFIESFGIFVALGIVYAFIITVSMIPALQLLINVKPAGPEAPHRSLLIRFGDIMEMALLHAISKHKKVVIFVIILVAAFALSGIARLKIDNQMIGYFSKDSRVYTDTKFIDRHFGGASTVEFTLSCEKAQCFKQKPFVKGLDRAIAKIKGIEDVGAVYALPDFIKLMNKGLHGDDPARYSLPDKAEAYPQYLFLYENGNGREIRNVVNEDYTKSRMVIFSKSDRTSDMDRIVTKATGYISKTLPNVKIKPSGFGEVLIATRDAVIYSQINSLLISFVLIFLFLIVLFRSIVYALLGIVPLVMTVMINFGLMGWLGFYLDVGSAIVAAIAIGIGVDNAIYYISYYRKTGAGENANIAAFRHAFGALYANSLVLGSGFLVLLLAKHQSLANLGWLVSATVIVSAAVTLSVLPILFEKLPLKKWIENEA